MSVAGFVLTGGESTRMGRDKATLPMHGQTLCEYIGDVVAAVTGSVVLVGHPERYGKVKYPCVADLHPGHGPLSGLETALCITRAKFNVITGCDSPNIQPEWLRSLISAAREGCRCVVAEDRAGIVQPLCGVYRDDCRDIVSAALTDRQFRMMDLLQELGAQTVKVDGVVLNINTPEQYAHRRI